jgi:predicted transcriptional regulator
MARDNALFDTSDPAAEAVADARADADVRNGRLISHDAVKRWLSSWGSPEPLPRPCVAD